MVVADICEINTLLGDFDFDAAREIYQNGKNSVKSSGDIRTIGGFAVAEGKSHGNSPATELFVDAWACDMPRAKGHDSTGRLEIKLYHFIASLRIDCRE